LISSREKRIESQFRKKRCGPNPAPYRFVPTLAEEDVCIFILEIEEACLVKLFGNGKILQQVMGEIQLIGSGALNDKEAEIDE
jgi:hypothetical protein